MSTIDLSKYTATLEDILKQKEKVDSNIAERDKKGGGELNWLYLEDGNEAIIRLVPLPGGRLSKEVVRYKFIHEKANYISPFHMAGVDDGVLDLQQKLEDCCRKTRDHVKKTYGEESQTWKDIEKFTNDVWKLSRNLRFTTEHYLLVLNYNNYRSPILGANGAYTLDPSDSEAYSSPLLFKQSESAFQNLLTQMSSPMYANPPITDFQFGARLTVHRDGKGKDTSYAYTIEPVRSPFPGAPDYPDLVNAPDLDKIFVPSSAAEIKEALTKNGYYRLLETFPQQVADILNGVSVSEAIPESQVPLVPVPPAPTSDPGSFWSGTPTWTTHPCKTCGKLLFTSPSGLTCENGHGVGFGDY